MGNEGVRFDLGGITAAALVPLAHVAAFVLGPLSIEPALRRISATDGDSRQLEPLMMQVLIALSSAKGATLSRNDLLGACWEGRIVSDDAINRVISRLRRVLDDLSVGRVKLETVPKVGYRLRITDTAEGAVPADAKSRIPWPRSLSGKRRALSAAVLAFVATTSAAFAGWSFLSAPASAANIAIGVESVDSNSSDREAKAFADALTGDLAQLAGAISRVSFVDDLQAGGTRPDYLLRIGVERERESLVARARFVQTEGGTVLWSARLVDSADKSDRLRQLVAMQAAGVMRCGLERSATTLGDDATARLFFSACEAVRNDDFARAQSFARQVVERRPDSAAGWACLALTTLGAAGPEATPQRVAAARREARGYALRALRIDPSSGRAYQALALTEQHGSAAQAAYLAKGIAAEPELSALHRVQSGALFSLGYIRASLAPAQRAFALDPTSTAESSSLQRRLLAVGRTAEGLAMQAKSERIWPDEPTTIRHRLFYLHYEPDPRAALATLARLAPRLPSGEPPPVLSGTELRWRADPELRDAAALEREAAAEFARLPANAWYIVAALNRMGEHERAFTWLERAPRDAPFSQWSILFWPESAAMRRDPRFFRAMARLGLIELWRERGRWPDFCSEPGLRYDCRKEAARLAAEGRT